MKHTSHYTSSEHDHSFQAGAELSTQASPAYRIAGKLVGTLIWRFGELSEHRQI